jgi:hypothetical protein
MSSDAVTGQFPADPGLGSEAQQRVDAIVAEAKRGLWKPQYQPAPAAPQPPMCPKLIDRRLSEEIQYVQRLLEMTGDQLAGDPAILQRHARAMQGFDLMSQILGHIARVVTADDKEATIDGIGMHDLRARLKRQAL